MDRILIDAFGGDNSPNEIIIGAIDALKIKDGFKISLIGMQKQSMTQNGLRGSCLAQGTQLGAL